MTLPQATGHIGGDPRAPRDKDLPREVPPGDADLDGLDDAKIIAAPDDPKDWDTWRRLLHRWRDEARTRIGYTGKRYERADLAWTQRCFSIGLLWLWDEQLYDYARHTFTVDGLINADAGLGGYDAVVLCRDYPLSFGRSTTAVSASSWSTTRGSAGRAWSAMMHRSSR